MGTAGFIAIEGTGFALAIGTYLYLAALSDQWPLGAPPPRAWAGTAMLILLLASLWPNALLKRWGKNEDLPRVRFGLVLMSVLGLATLFVRGWEFTALNIRWDDNAYGSILWVLLGLHAMHLGTDVADTIVLTALMFTRHGHGRRFTDVTDNAFYWDFVVAAWVPIYALIYWFARW